MFEKQERTIIGLAISISAIALVVVVVLITVNRQPAEQFQTERPKQIQTEHQHYEHRQSKPFAESTGESAKSDMPLHAPRRTKPTAAPKASLNDIIKAARTWRPAYNLWFGEMAPDFTLTDITGKKHKLSDYRGKNVLIIFWATWCRPCLMEIPDLIALRNIISEDKLAMLAISSENPALVKKFVAQRKINYTVLSDRGTMPTPFNAIRSIPCSFFISPDGKIKLGTVGLLSLGTIKAILQAE